MVDKLKNQSPEKGSVSSSHGDGFSKKEISEKSRSANPKDAESFADAFSKKRNNKEGGQGNLFEKKQDPWKQENTHPFHGDERLNFHGDNKNTSGGGFQSTRGRDNFQSNRSEVKFSNSSGQTTDFHKRIDSPINAYESVSEKKSTERSEEKDSAVVKDIKDASILSGMKILDSLQMQRIEPSSAEAANVIKNLGIEVAQRIIASHEALNAKQEVRITLQESILKETEVFITKDGKSLSVNFFTQSDESANILNHRSGELRMQLMEKLQDIDHIEIGVEQQESNDGQGDDNHSGNQRRNQQDDDQDNKN
ncbi:MAG: hypothetical protein LBI56_01140 [Puniceicoccales bacterium]|jgi:hypothetical protein|nr:hypothetical protein [Puniceicoccales bacterium]